MLIGILVCLFISEVNALILKAFDNDVSYVTTVITPISEEVVKAIPILFYAVVFDNKKDTIMANALALGIGFGLFENTVLLVQNIGSVTLLWAVIRGFSTALMHGICTLSVGLGISFVKKKKKLFFSGIFALLTLAMVYHGIFNMLQTDYKWIGSLIPIVTYIPMLVVQYVLYKGKKKTKKAVPQKEIIPETGSAD